MQPPPLDSTASGSMTAEQGEELELWHHTPLVGCVGYFSHCSDKKAAEERFIWAPGSRMLSITVGKAWWQEVTWLAVFPVTSGSRMDAGAQLTFLCFPSCCLRLKSIVCFPTHTENESSHL